MYSDYKAIMYSSDKSRICKNKTTQKIQFGKIGLFIIIFTASFDIFGVINIAGMTFRIPQFITLFMFAVLAFRDKIQSPKYFNMLYIWAALQFVFALFCPNKLYSIGYWGWTIIVICMVIVFCSIIDTPQKTRWLIKNYILVFVLMSWLGIIQWILGFFGIHFFLTQVTFNGTRMPRINGFTYEPSYYSTYLMPGWVLIMYLLEHGSVVFSKKQVSRYAMIISLALFMSSSRMGWIFMGLYMLLRFMIAPNPLFMKNLRKRRMIYISVCILGAICVAMLAIYLIAKNGYGFIFDGLGIGGTSSHSSGARTTQFLNTLQLFFDQPFLGYSLGGVSVAYCNKYQIVPFDSGASMCVWIELLAGSGIIGIIPFAIWVSHILKHYRKEKVKYSIFVRESKGLLYAFVFECMILAMNQNILRIYFWVLVAVLIIVGRTNRFRMIYI